jgi:hypothetical protein
MALLGRKHEDIEDKMIALANSITIPTIQPLSINFTADKETKKENIAAGGGSQIYIGTPAGVILCVNGLGDVEDPYDLDAYLWHGYRPDAVRVTVPEHMLDEMEELEEQFQELAGRIEYLDSMALTFAPKQLCMCC